VYFKWANTGIRKLGALRRETKTGNVLKERDAKRIVLSCPKKNTIEDRILK
jgi:hypothetical protein